MVLKLSMYDLKMSHQLFFSVCILLAVTALDGKNLQKQYKIARDDIPLSSMSYEPPRPPGACEFDRVKCPTSDRCIPQRWFCDGDNDCGDGSDETGDCPIPDFTQTMTPFEPDRPPFQQNLEPQMPSPEELSCFTALMQASHTCGESPFPGIKISSSNERVIFDKLVEMDLHELCGLVQTWYGCYKSSLSACDNVNNPMLADVKQMMSIGDVSLNYVCVQEIEVFNRNKACLLKETSTESSRYSPELALKQALASSCMQAVSERRPETPWCFSHELHNCAKDAVAEQCGDELASALSGLADLVQAAAGCSTYRARNLPYSQKQHRGFSFNKRA